jgi:hypothetical protein
MEDFQSLPALPLWARLSAIQASFFAACVCDGPSDRASADFVLNCAGPGSAHPVRFLRHFVSICAGPEGAHPVRTHFVSICAGPEGAYPVRFLRHFVSICAGPEGAHPVRFLRHFVSICAGPEGAYPVRTSCLSALGPRAHIRCAFSATSCLSALGPRAHIRCAFFPPLLVVRQTGPLTHTRSSAAQGELSGGE